MVNDGVTITSADKPFDGIRRVHDHNRWSLSEGRADQDSFGQEAVDTLIKEMEDKRKNVIVILAGYDARQRRGRSWRSWGWQGPAADDINDLLGYLDVSCWGSMGYKHGKYW